MKERKMIWLVTFDDGHQIAMTGDNKTDMENIKNMDTWLREKAKCVSTTAEIDWLVKALQTRLKPSPEND